MSVNGVTSNQTSAAYSTYSSTAAATETATEEKAASTTTEDKGVVYEPSKKTENVKKTYKPDTKLINQLKADADARTAQLRSLVEQLMGKQANAYGKANNMWDFLRSGNYTVDAATQAQAQADIAEDGYWGVNQTSDRILSFANALTGGDPDKIEEMRAAFQKGYEKAQKTWGGKLPDLCQKTYDAVMKKFDEQAAQAKGASATEE